MIDFSRRFKNLLDSLVIFTGSKTLYDCIYKVPDFPDRLNVEVTNHCNASCIMCPMQNMTREEGKMSFGLFRKIIGEATEQNIRRVAFHIAGEPLLHPKLEEMIEYAKTSGIPETQLTTNASLLTKEKAGKLLDAGVDYVFISIDGGTKELYEQIRGLSYETVIRNLKNFVSLLREREVRGPIVNIRLIEFSDIQKEVEKFKKDWRELTADLPNVSVEEKKFSSMGQQISSDSMERLKDVGKRKIQDSFEKPTLYDQLFNNQAILCSQIYNWMNIHYDGNVTGCCFDMNKHLSLGDACSSSLYEI